MYINERLGYFQDWITQVWVKVTGKTFDPDKDKWLVGPLGTTRLIKDKFLHDLATTEDLELKEDEQNSGLLENIEVLGLVRKKKCSQPQGCRLL